jgi:hypothetical protein
VAAPRRGYGSACLAGLLHLARRPGGPPDVVVFADADGSDVPGELPDLLRPLAEGRADLVIGVRRADRVAPGAMTAPQRFGNRLAGALIRLLYGRRVTDLGPFRAVRWSALERLAMRDPDYGWTVEMQVRAIRLGLVTVEVPVSYRRRVGRSKISGTLRGVAGAGWKILTTIALETVRPLPPAGAASYAAPVINSKSQLAGEASAPAPAAAGPNTSGGDPCSSNTT